MEKSSGNGKKATVAVVLAAGMGTRMKSALPKVLHPLLGEAMITYVLRALEEAGVRDIFAVLGHGGDQVEALLKDSVTPVYQREQLGTGHALLTALPRLRACGGGECLVVCGDTPLLTGDTLARLRDCRARSGAAAAVLTALAEDPAGYGRIVEKEGKICAIVEEKDADESQRQIKEINAGAYAFDLELLAEALEQLTPANAQGEYYLTDTVAWLAARGFAAVACRTDNAEEAWGVNDRVQLAKAQDRLRHRILEGHMLAGVTVEEPASTIVGPLVKIGRDTVLETGCQLFGRTAVGEGCVIGPRSRITDCRIGDGTSVNQSTAADCVIGARCDIGPYTYLRPGCVLEDKVKAGAFVEMKKTAAAEGAKIPHLSYIGDCSIGKKVNIGAGTITCNYDGVSKNQTVIGDGAFIGSNSNLVAPVTVGEGAYTAAGSTITLDVPPNALGVARGKQSNILRWRRPAGK